MKNIIKIITILFATAYVATSCVLDDYNLADEFNDGLNFTSFSRLTQNLSAVADGNEYDFAINLELQGPNLIGFTEDITVKIEVVSSESTAVEGVNYRFATKTVTLTKSNNYIGSIPITVVTDGIVAPLAVNPKLVLSITDSSGNVFSNSKNTTLTFVYQCYADLSGTYLVTNDGCANFVPFTTTIVANADGSWRVAIGDGGFLGYGCTGNPGLDNGANITELCGDILASDDLDYGGLGIGNITGGSWDAENGILTMNHTQTFTGNWAGSWTSTYTRQ